MNLFLELLDEMTHVFANDLGERCLQAVLFGRAQLDQLPAARHQLAQFGLFFRANLNRPRLGLLCEAGDDSRIQAVSLGQDAQAASEVADLTRIHHGHLVAGGHERADQAALITSGGFDHDQAVAGRRQLIEKLSKAGAGVLNGEAPNKEHEGHKVRLSH